MLSRHKSGIQVVKKDIEPSQERKVYTKQQTNSQLNELIHSYYRGAVGALLVYGKWNKICQDNELNNTIYLDITRASSFQDINHWLKELTDHADEKISLMLVGNKVDLADTQRAVSTEEAGGYAQDCEMMFLETSALDATNVEAAFVQVFERIYNDMPKSVKQKTKDVVHGPGQNTIQLAPPIVSSDVAENNEKKTNGGGCC